MDVCPGTKKKSETTKHGAAERSGEEEEVSQEDVETGT